MEQPLILGTDGKPARKPEDEPCPRCGADKDTRVASAGFGAPHPVCRQCGYEWHGEVFRVGSERR